LDVFHLRDQLVEHYREYVESDRSPALTMQRREAILATSAPRWISPLGLRRGFVFPDGLCLGPSRFEVRHAH
jgi:hypothetical protein